MKTQKKHQTILQDISNDNTFRIRPKLMLNPLEENKSALSDYNLNEESEQTSSVIKFQQKRQPQSMKPFRLNEVDRIVTEESSQDDSSSSISGQIDLELLESDSKESNSKFNDKGNESLSRTENQNSMNAEIPKAIIEKRPVQLDKLALKSPQNIAILESRATYATETKSISDQKNQEYFSPVPLQRISPTKKT